MKISLKGLRANRDLTIKEASKQLGIAPRTLQYWEYGRTFPNTNQLARICEIYQCDVSDINFNLPKALDKT